MMNNSQFLKVIKNSFICYLETSPRSNKKLCILHGSIAEDINKRLDDTSYTVCSLGFEKKKEEKIKGRYIFKSVDITIKENGNPIAGIAVKFVMSNYSQNSNNYFENMLGETANIRCSHIPYFQIFVIPDKIPYFNKDNEISKWERINETNLRKYTILSNDNVDAFLHTPSKALVYVVSMKSEGDEAIADKQEYKDYYLNNEFEITESNINCSFGSGIIYNDYDTFIQKVVHTIKSL